MLGVILAGGLGTRLRPLTDVTNKHLLPVGNYPMIYHPLWQVKQFGCKRVVIVTGTEHAGSVFETIGSGKKFGLNAIYRVQDKPLGIADALLLVEPIVRDYDDMVVMLGDNIYEETLARMYDVGCLDPFPKAVVYTTYDPCPSSFGVVEMCKDGLHVKNIVEKPEHPKTNDVQTGCYIYHDSRNLFEMIRKLKLSKRGQFEITDLNNMFAKKRELVAIKLNCHWTDAGTHESYKYAQTISRKLEF